MAFWSSQYYFKGILVQIYKFEGVPRCAWRCRKKQSFGWD